MQPSTTALPAASQLLASGKGCVTYWSVRDTTASSGSVWELYDGTGSNGQLLGTYGTVVKQSTSEYVRKMHLPFSNGLYYNLVSGTLVGAVTHWLAYSDAEWQEILQRFTAAS